jgi:hypothetical protein
MLNHYSKTPKLNHAFMMLEDVEVDVDFYYYPGRPAKLFDLPENCYPEEYPEVEIDKVLISGTEIEIGSLLSEEAIQKIETNILENAKQV